MIAVYMCIFSDMFDFARSSCLSALEHKPTSGGNVRSTDYSMSRPTDEGLQQTDNSACRSIDDELQPTDKIASRSTDDELLPTDKPIIVRADDELQQTDKSENRSTDDELLPTDNNASRSIEMNSNQVIEDMGTFALWRSSTGLPP